MLVSGSANVCKTPPSIPTPGRIASESGQAAGPRKTYKPKDFDKEKGGISIWVLGIRHLAPATQEETQHTYRTFVLADPQHVD